MLKLFKMDSESQLACISLLLIKHFIQYGSEWVRLEFVAISLVELVLELHPVETERVQEALEQIHAHEDAEGDAPKKGP